MGATLVWRLAAPVPALVNPLQVAVVELKARKEKLVELQKAMEDVLKASEAAFDD